MTREVVTLERFNCVPASEHRLAQSGFPIYRLAEQVMDIIIRRVFYKLYLFLDHAFFLFEPSLVKSPMEKDVGEKVNSPVDVLVEDLNIESSIFARSESIQVTTQTVYVDSDVMGGPLFSPLEEHVLQEMRDTVFIRGLVA